MGRKPLSDARKSETPLRIRVTQEERRLLDNAAARAGQPTSTWARETLLKIAHKSQT